jgi:hypothetical protein
MDEKRMASFLTTQTSNYHCFKHVSINTETASLWTTKSIVSMLRRFFKSSYDSYLFIYIGHSDSSSNLLINPETTLSFTQLKDLFF